MKNKLWFLQLPIILLALSAYLGHEAGSEGRITNRFFMETIYPGLKRFSAFFTDFKFNARGPISPKNKIVIVEIDSPSIEAYGRWPWHRDIISALIYRTFMEGAKVVGLDMVFSEQDKRVSRELEEYLKSKNLEYITPAFETDHLLEKTIAAKADNLVLGWTSEVVCSPMLHGKEDCPILDPEIVKIPQNFEKFSYSNINPATGFAPDKTAIWSILSFLPNWPSFDAEAKHAGYFNAFADPDGYIRQTSLLMIGAGKPYPSLPLEMARVGLGEELQVTFDAVHRVHSLGFIKSGRTFPVNPAGLMQVNFRGGTRTFPYISAIDLLSDDEKFNDVLDRRLASDSKKEVLKDAYVLIGVSALGVFDMRSFPFGANTPGVEGHANILDNILSGDPLLSESKNGGRIVMLLLMSIGAIGFAFLTQRLESIPALLAFLLIFTGFGLLDVQMLFKNNYNWDTGFFMMEIFSIFIFTLMVKYILEEKNKKFLRSAFTKYVSPAIVDSIIKDPTKLSLGGERRELTILFSDIRSFTTFSEQMDAKALSQFLNDYLGIMTKIVFEHHGTLDKYIGDAVMAFWGAPLENNSHAKNACSAAAAMMKALWENQKRWKTDFGVTVNIGIGMNTGVVSVGNMGSDTNFEYTVIGDHVNLASRLEGLTKAYGVTIVTTRFTFDSIQKINEPQPPHRVLDFVKVKGKKKAVELIQVLDREYSPEGLKLWEEGRVLYSQQKWDEAIAKFEEAGKLLAISPDVPDGPCTEFIQRCKDFKQSSPGTDWDGSWEMHSK